MLGLHIANLTDADAMLASAGAAHSKRAFDHLVIDPLCGFEFLFIAGLKYESDMEIAVAGMANNGCEQAALVNIPLRFQKAFGEA